MSEPFKSTPRWGRYFRPALWQSLLAAMSAVGCFSGPLDARQQPGQIEAPSVILTLINDVDVPARERGVIESLLVEPNQTVTAGQRLAGIDEQDKQIDLRRSQLELEISQANAESDILVRRAQEELATAEVALQRGESAREQFSASVSDADLAKLKLAAVQARLVLESAQLERKNAQLKMQLVENQVKQVEAAIERHHIVSPLDGVVAVVNRSRGEWVEPGDIVVRVIGISKLRAEGFVDASLISAKSRGSQVTLFRRRADGKEEAFQGQISFVSDEVDPVNQQVRIWAEVDNSELKLRPGDRGRLVIAK